MTDRFSGDALFKADMWVHDRRSHIKPVEMTQLNQLRYLSKSLYVEHVRLMQQREGLRSERNALIEENHRLHKEMVCGLPFPPITARHERRYDEILRVDHTRIFWEIPTYCMSHEVVRPCPTPPPQRVLASYLKRFDEDYVPTLRKKAEAVIRQAIGIEEGSQ